MTTQFEKFMENSMGYSLKIEANSSEIESLMVSDILFHVPIISLALMIIFIKRKI